MAEFDERPAGEVEAGLRRGCVISRLRKEWAMGGKRLTWFVAERQSPCRRAEAARRHSQDEFEAVPSLATLIKTMDRSNVDALLAWMKTAGARWADGVEIRHGVARAPPSPVALQQC